MGLFQIQGGEGFVGNGLQIGALGCKLQRSSPYLSVGYPGLGDLLQGGAFWFPVMVCVCVHVCVCMYVCAYTHLLLSRGVAKASYLTDVSACRLRAPACLQIVPCLG